MCEGRATTLLQALPFLSNTSRAVATVVSHRCGSPALEAQAKSKEAFALLQAVSAVLLDTHLPPQEHVPQTERCFLERGALHSLGVCPSEIHMNEASRLITELWKHDLTSPLFQSACW